MIYKGDGGSLKKYLVFDLFVAMKIPKKSKRMTFLLLACFNASLLRANSH